MNDEDLEKRVAKLELWASKHDGRIDAWWEAQHEWNGKIEPRVSAVEKRLIWFAGFSAAVGAYVGNMVG